MKKSTKKKIIKLATEIAKNEIEKHVSEYHNLSITTSSTNNAPIAKYSETQSEPIGNTEQLTELPEKWCIEVTQKNLDILSKWQGDRYLMPHYRYVDYKGFYSLLINKKYTLITFEQFKKWVLKEDDLTTVETEKPLSIREVQVLVNSQEEANELAEIARYLGQKIGNKEIMEYKPYNTYGYVYFCLKEDEFGVYRRDNSKTEITIQEFKKLFGKPKEIDWSKPGQLVESEYVKAITNGSHSGYLFSGFILKSSQNIIANRQVETLIKSQFKLCTEPITLQND